MLQKSHEDGMANAPSALPNGVALLQDPALNKGTAARIAAAVAGVAYRRGLARGAEPPDLLAFVKSQMYEPRYASYLAD